MLRSSCAPQFPSQEPKYGSRKPLHHLSQLQLLKHKKETKLKTHAEDKDRHGL